MPHRARKRVAGKHPDEGMRQWHSRHLAGIWLRHRACARDTERFMSIFTALRKLCTSRTIRTDTYIHRARAIAR
jgi:hypothetical protein